MASISYAHTTIQLFYSGNKKSDIILLVAFSSFKV